MVEIGLKSLCLCLVFGSFGAFDFALRIVDWIAAKRWYLVLVMVVVMVIGFFVFERIYGKWFVIV